MLTPTQRSTRAKIGAHSLHAKYDSKEITRPARIARTAAIDARILAEIDPTGILPPEERERRLEHGRKAYFGKLALLSARVRQQRKEQGLPPTVEDPSALRKIARLLSAEGGGGNA